MTNEKAISIIKNAFSWYEDNARESEEEDWSGQHEALDLAIKALEQQPRDCKSCIHSDKGKCAGSEECHECMWESKYEQQPNRCDNCIHSEEQDGSNCYECVKGMADNFEAQPTNMRDATEEERKSVKDYIESISKPTGVHFDETQPCEDCISREGIKEFINTMLTSNEEMGSIVTNEGRWVEEKMYLHGVEILEGLSEYVNDLPPVTPQRPKGKWIEIEIDAGEFIYKCTKCGMRVINPYKYCPICGADMSGGGEDGDSN